MKGIAMLALESFAQKTNYWIDNRFPEPINPTEAKNRYDDDRPLPVRKLVDEHTGKAISGDNTQNIPYMEYHLWSMEKVRPYRKELLNIAQGTQEVGKQSSNFIKAAAVQDVISKMSDIVKVNSTINKTSMEVLNYVVGRLFHMSNKNT
jgi:hypothetical protein